MGPIVAQAGSLPWDELLAQYAQVMNENLSHLATRKTHSNVLQHLLGFFKQTLRADEKQEFIEILDQYRQGIVPLIVPLTLLRHHIRHNDVPDWLHQQVYLNPYPKELMLQNA